MSIKTGIVNGVATIEIKSGYGLDLANERKSLAAARRLGGLRDVTVRTSFLGAHAPPPEAAPLDGNLAGLPPLYLAAAGLDPLRDDTTRLAARLAESGVEFRYDHVPGVVHGCLRMSRRLAPAKTMITAASAMLAGALET